ncbi:PIG-L deacetylase family protein [Paenibacillus planticolens]|uniref:PIG-L family deacetylase n=1 Tax=Paenibacillus planticolens TaxID=2654976 RepID=A0ABX1ZFK8_9BACL|nr:PIG-L family deacetylase [Paenibacillus planticolens]NOU98660.1 PIG-L family deacetylase [Paenibacillus planticolens]
MNKEIRVIVIGAHPDEPDIYAGGTAALYASMGHKVKFVSLTNGSAGHFSQMGDDLVQRRKKEADEAAKRLGVIEYEVLDIPDGELEPNVETRKKVIRLIREWKADIVITFHPEGGRHADNRYAGKLVSDAASFIALTPNCVPEVPCLEKSPIFLLMPDYSMRPYYTPSIVIDFESVLEQKLLGCDAHATQFYEFAPWQGKFTEEVPELWADKRNFLLRGWESFFRVSQEMKPILEKYYGAEHANKVVYAEPFEMARYSRKPSQEEMEQLFPMFTWGE